MEGKENHEELDEVFHGDEIENYENTAVTKIREFHFEKNVQGCFASAETDNDISLYSLTSNFVYVVKFKRTFDFKYHFKTLHFMKNKIYNLYRKKPILLNVAKYLIRLNDGICQNKLMKNSGLLSSLAQLVIKGRKKIITGNRKGELQIWDENNWICEKTIELAHKGAILNMITLSNVEDSSLIVTSSNDNYMKIWDISLGQCIINISIGCKELNCISYFYHKKKTFIISFGGDGNYRLSCSDSQEILYIFYSDWDDRYVTKLLIDKNEEGDIRIFAASETKIIIRSLGKDIKNTSLTKTIYAGDWEDKITSLIKIKLGKNIILISGHFKRFIKIWDINSKNCKMAIPLDTKIKYLCHRHNKG